MHICYIGNELYPVDRGGIARLIHNMALQVLNELPDAHVHILLPVEYADRIDGIAAHFPNRIHLWCCPNQAEVKKRLGGAEDSQLNGIGRHPQLFCEAAAFMFGALDIETAIGAKLTHIEVPDHLGYGNLILTARECGLAFQTAEIACRIHSSFSELLRFEPDYYPTDSWHAARIDMEAECLRLADRIIAPLEAIATIVEESAVFPAGKQVEINFPAVLSKAPDPEPLPENHAPDFVFASRFQPFKRPDLFIRGAVQFLDRNPDYLGKLRLMAYAFEPMYLAGLRMMVPQRYSAKILFETDLSEQARHARLASSIVVQPSAYESLCLLAYEIGAKQRPILLAKDCAAFANEPRWSHKNNCLLFDPSPDGLADTMQTALRWRPTALVSSNPDQVWMQNGESPRKSPTNASAGAVLVGPVSDPSQIPKIRTLSHRIPANWALHVYTIGVDLQDAFDNPEITCHVADASHQQSKFVERILSTLHDDVVCLTTPDALPHSNLLEAACRLDVATVLSALTTQSGNLNCFAGRAPTLALQDSRLAPSCLCLHRNEALRLLAKLNNARRLVANLVMALQNDRLNLVIAPQVWIDQEASPFKNPEDIRLHGTQLRHAQRRIDPARTLGMVDRTNGTSLPLLNEAPVELTLVSDDTPIGDKIDLTIPAGVTTIALQSNTPLWGHMLRFTVVPGGDVPSQPISLSLTSRDGTASIGDTQILSLALNRHQLILAGPFYETAELEFTFERSAEVAPVSFSLRRIKRLSPA